MNIICTFISSFPAKFNSYIHSLSHYSLLSKLYSKQTKGGNEDCEKICIVLGLCNFYKETKSIRIWTQSHSQPPFSEHGQQIRILSLWLWSISLGNSSNWKYHWSVMLLPLPGQQKAAEWAGRRAGETHPPPGGSILRLTLQNGFCKDTPKSWETQHLSFFIDCRVKLGCVTLGWKEHCETQRDSKVSLGTQEKTQPSGRGSTTLSAIQEGFDLISQCCKWFYTEMTAKLVLTSYPAY